MTAPRSVDTWLNALRAIAHTPCLWEKFDQRAIARHAAEAMGYTDIEQDFVVDAVVRWYFREVDKFLGLSGDRR